MYVMWAVIGGTKKMGVCVETELNKKAFMQII